MLIGDKVVDEEKVKVLIDEIKKKKELQEISDDFVRDQLFAYLQQEPKLVSSLGDKGIPASFFLLICSIQVVSP